MLHTLHRALFHVDDQKMRVKIGALLKVAATRFQTALSGGNREAGEWQVTFGQDVFSVRLRGFYSDGPYCSCVSPESHLCLHILIVILGGAYTLSELLDFGFYGTLESGLNQILFRTCRGAESPGDLEDHGPSSVVEHVDGVESVEVSDDEQKFYFDMLGGLSAAFEHWRRLQPASRERLRPHVWSQFRSLLEAKDVKRRTLQGQVIATSSRLPVLGSGFRGRRGRHGNARVHSVTLQSVAVSETVARRHESKTVTARKERERKELKDVKVLGDIEPFDRLMAQRLRDFWGGTRGLNNLSVRQLQILCKGYGYGRSGTLLELRQRILFYDSVRHPSVPWSSYDV